MAFGALPYQLCRDSRSVEELATEAIAVSTNNDSTYIKGFGLVLGGWARAQRKLTDDGIAKMRLGLDALRAVDAVLMLAYFSSLLAEVYGQIGQASQGLQVLNEIDSSRDRYWVAELDRLRGELTLKQAGSARAREGEATAEECFRRALNTAHEQNAKSLELRAAVSLSRLLAAQGKRAEALTLMSEQYASFGEGFETQDLREARKLIAELEKHETSLRKRR
jgi:predicted ATPase